MAENSLQYDLLVDARQGLGELAKFAKAQEAAVKRIKAAQDEQVKSNVEVDQSIIRTRAALSKTRAELVRYTKSSKKHGHKIEETANKHLELTRQLQKQKQELTEGKRAVTEYTKQLDKLQRQAAKGIDVRSPNVIPAPPRMFGPGFDGVGQNTRRGRLTRRVANLSARTSGAFSALGGAAGSGGLLAPLASGVAFQQSVSGALDLDSQRNKLRLLSEQYGEYDKILKIIDSSATTFNKSQREATTEFANVFARLRPLGVELNDIKGVYEGFNTVAIASGATSEASRIAFMQLAQAIGSGRLAGDEFRSVSEQIPGVLIPIAQTMGVAVGELKQLGSEGKITSDVLIHALSHGVNISKEEIAAFLAQQPAQKFKAFSNSVSDLGVAVGNVLLPVLTPLVENLTELVKGFLELPDPIRNILIVLGTTFLAVTALAAAFKTLGLATGAKFVGNLLATAGGIKFAGNASSAAAGKVALLAAQLKGLAVLGIITVGVNFLMMGAKQGASLEAEIAKLEAGGPGATFEGASRETVVAARERALKTKGEIDKELEDIRPNGLVSAIPVVGPVVAGMAGSRAQQLKAREANNQTILDLDPNDFQTEAQITAARAKALKDALAKSLKDNGTGPDIVGQLARAEANNALRLTQKKAQVALKVARDEYKLRGELEKSNHQLQEANLVGVARETQAILNAQIASFRELEVREQQLDDEVTQAEQRLQAAEQRLLQATGPVDAAKAAGAVSIADAELAGVRQRRAQFQGAIPTMIGNIQSGVGAQLTEEFRQQTEQLQNQAKALRSRNELIAQGASPEVIEGELAKLEIDRRANDMRAQLAANNQLNAEALARITTEAQNAKNAVDELTAAQLEGTTAIDDYISSAMDFVTDTKARVTDMLTAVDNAFANSIEAVLTGTMTIQESFHSFFKSVGAAFLKMASQMIAKLIIIKLLKTAIGLFGSGAGEASGASATDAVTMGASPTQAAAITGGGAVEWSTDMPLNAGNILETFAKGGVVTGPTAALIGEGGMNEAVVPLPNGRAIPVDMTGAAGGNITSNVTVNVSTDGETSSSGQNGAAKLGKAIDTAVRKVILDERRSGGLLYSGR